MAEKAKGNHPKGVSAVILTPEEAEQKKNEIAQQQANIAGQGPQAQINVAPGGVPLVQHPAPGITATQTIPNPPPGTTPQIPMSNQAPDLTHNQLPEPTPSQQAPTTVADESDLVYGRAAFKMAEKLSLPYLWDLQGNPVALPQAAIMMQQDPKSVVFDIDRLLEFDDVDPDAQETEDITQDDNPDQSYMAELVEPTENEIPLPPQQPVQVDHLTEREKRAWGGTLSTPGMQVYIHPKGIARVEVEGPVKIQRGIQGNVRTFRVTRKVTVGATPTVAESKPVQPPMTRSPNPNVNYRMNQPTQSQPEKIPIPVPKKFEPSEEEEF